MSNSEQKACIATWNLERPKRNGWAKNQRCLDQIQSLDADVWVLTETNTAIALGDDYTSVSSQPWKDYHTDGENCTTLWSRWEVCCCIPTFDPHIAVCAEINSPLGPLIVYGTVITYANDSGVDGTSKRWEEHRKSINLHFQDWLRIRTAYPNHLMCIAGDFNQSRDQSGWYEDAQAVQMLTSALQDLSLKCVTEMDMRARGMLHSRASVDHICLSEQLVSIASVTAWEGKRAGEPRMSDHNGVLVKFKL